MFQIITVALFALVSSTAFAAPAHLFARPVQQMNCFPSDVDAPDRLVIALYLPANRSEIPFEGTLFLSSGLDPDGEQDSTGVLNLDLIPETDDDAARGLVRYEARNRVSIFTVSIFEKYLARTLKSFTIHLDLDRTDEHYHAEDELTCYATVFEN